jgi:hypothetical protein
MAGLKAFFFNTLYGYITRRLPTIVFIFLVFMTFSLLLLFFFVYLLSFSGQVFSHLYFLCTLMYPFVF